MMRASIFPLMLLTLSLDASEGLTLDPKVEVSDTTGAVRRPFDVAGKKAIVLIFIARDCPICNVYVPEINRLHAAFTSKNITFYAVHSDPDTTAAQAREHAREYSLKPIVLVDKSGTLAERTGATVTPEAVVIDQDGNVFYRGRIDDLFAAYGKKRNDPTNHELQSALEAILEGKSAPKADSAPVGCFIPGVKSKK